VSDAKRTSLVVDAALKAFYRSRADKFWTRPSSWQRAVWQQHGHEQGADAAPALAQHK
jgi:hypothetical protein